METKRIVECLRRCEKITGRADCVGCDYLYLGGLDCYHVLKKDARKRLEELEEQNETWKKQLCDKEYLVSKAEGRVMELEKQLYEKKSEWISVEDERKPKHGQNCFVAYTFNDSKMQYYGTEFYCDNGKNTPHFTNEGILGMRVTHWMEIPKLPEPPKPKEPTFKDVFLEKFPKAATRDDGSPKSCAKVIFPYMKAGRCSFVDACVECWNQPYFEEEGEADA